MRKVDDDKFIFLFLVESNKY